MTTITNAINEITTAAILSAHARMEQDGCMSRSEVLALADSLSSNPEPVALEPEWIGTFGLDGALDLYRREELAALRSCAESIEEVMADCA